MTILDKIVAQKHLEIEIAQTNTPVKILERATGFTREPISLRDRLQTTTGVIAEFKRRSPSKGTLNDKADPVVVARQYEAAGVAACSMLTDESFFGGSNEDLIRVRGELNIPLLRKDFMIDEYQFVEARSIGADVILLIAAILTKNEVKTFTDLAQNLGLEVLLELHGEDELDHVYHKVNMVGINNRDLKTFEVDMDRSLRMAEKLGKDFALVAESGISQPADVKEFRNYGFSGFLIGENFMKTTDPGRACLEFIAQLQ